MCLLVAAILLNRLRIFFFASIKTSEQHLDWLDSKKVFSVLSNKERIAAFLPLEDDFSDSLTESLGDERGDERTDE